MKMIKVLVGIVLLTLPGIISEARAELVFPPAQNTSTIEIENIVRYLPPPLINLFKSFSQIKQNFYSKYNQLNLKRGSFKEIFNKIIDGLISLITGIVGIIEIAAKWIAAVLKWILEIVLDFILSAVGRIKKL
jgi:hypothetical protein